MKKIIASLPFQNDNKPTTRPHVSDSKMSENELDVIVCFLQCFDSDLPP
jgi:hypothetical protein